MKIRRLSTCNFIGIFYLKFVWEIVFRIYLEISSEFAARLKFLLELSVGISDSVREFRLITAPISSSVWQMF